MSEVLEILTDLIGTDNTNQVIDKFGGGSFFVSYNSDFAKKLKQVLSIDDTNKVIAMFLGDSVYIPKNHRSKVQQKHKLIAKAVYDDIANGMKKMEVIQKNARKFGYSERHLWAIIKAHSSQNSNNQQENKPTDGLFCHQNQPMG